MKPGRLFWLACWTDVWGFPRGRQPRGRNPPDGVTAELDSEAPILQGGFFCFRPLGSEEPGGGALLSGNAVSGAKSTPGSSFCVVVKVIKPISKGGFQSPRIRMRLFAVNRTKTAVWSPMSAGSPAKPRVPPSSESSRAILPSRPIDFARWRYLGRFGLWCVKLSNQESDYPSAFGQPTSLSSRA